MISMTKFYLIGGILFSAGTIGTIINSKILWVSYNIGGKISAVASVFTQILFAVLFIGLYLQIKKQNNLVNNPAVEEFIKELQMSPEESNNKKDIEESIFNTNIIKKSILHRSDSKKNKSKNKFKSENEKHNYVIN